MTASVRRATAGDLDRIAELEGRWTTTARWTRSQFAAELEAPGGLLLVAEKGGVAGFIVARLLPPDLMIYDLAVDPERARQGVGRSLIEAAAAEARRAGCERMTLEVSAANAGGKAFYDAVGLRVVGRRPKFYNDGSDAILMDLRLQEK